jgi:hypothetical protein
VGLANDTARRVNEVTAPVNQAPGPAIEPPPRENDAPGQGHDAHSGDLERSFRSIMNTDSGDHEHPHEPA